jgi:hypothetical protein
MAPVGLVPIRSADRDNQQRQSFASSRDDVNFGSPYNVGLEDLVLKAGVAE